MPLEPQKVKNYPRIKSKSNVRIEGNIADLKVEVFLVSKLFLAQGPHKLYMTVGYIML